MLRRKKDVNYFPPIDSHSTLERILHHDAFAAVFLLVAAVAAFVFANLNAPDIKGVAIHFWYEEIWKEILGFTAFGYSIEKPLHLWINDGLMAVFFFVVGLEIKRELMVGELASLRKAMLPIAAAIGGMVCPAAVFAIINFGGEGAHGWGIPMATDIAFAAGVIGLLSGRVPSSLAVFLIALAIVDDLGAVMVIALFYTERIATEPLMIGIGLILMSAFCAQIGVRNAIVYLILAAAIWFTFLQSGVHATVAGVLFAFTIPVNARYETPYFVGRVRDLASRFEAAEDHANARLVNNPQQRIVRAIEAECIHVEAPLQRIENKLHPWTALMIMPLFAFANAGVRVDFSAITDLLLQPVTLGVFFGLLVGKQVGITLFSYVTVKMGLAELPAGMNWKQVYALSWLGAIGFTMSLFISELAFMGGHAVHAAAVEHGAGGGVPHGEAHLAEAKVGTLLASIVAGVGGTIMLYLTTGDTKNEAKSASAH